MRKRLLLELIIVLLVLCSVVVFAEQFEWAIYAEPGNVTWQESFTKADNLPKTESFGEDVFVISSGQHYLQSKFLHGVSLSLGFDVKKNSDKVFEKIISKTNMPKNSWVNIPGIDLINKTADSVVFYNLLTPDNCFEDENFVWVCPEHILKSTFNFSKISASGSANVLLKDGIKKLYDTDEASNVYDLVDDQQLLADTIFHDKSPVYIASLNPKVLVGLSPGNLGSFVKTEVHSDVMDFKEDIIYVCVDFDEDGVCDYNVGRDCKDDGGDYYKGLCCGVSYGVSSNTYKNDNINAFCTKDNNNNPVWVPLEYVGEIFDLPDADIVSNGSKFLVCGQKPSALPAENSSVIPDNSFFSIQQNNIMHEYFCFDGVLTECGGDQPFSSVNSVGLGYKLSLSQPVDNSKTYFCADSVWLNGSSVFLAKDNWDCSSNFCDYYINQTHFIRCDSDKQNCTLKCEISSNNVTYCYGGVSNHYVAFPAFAWVKNLDGSPSACVAGGFNFTGTKCCGETENEFYEDPWTTEPLSQTPGICWNSSFLPDGTVFENYSLLVYKGKTCCCSYSGVDCPDLASIFGMASGSISTTPATMSGNPVCTDPFLDVDSGHHAALCTPNGWVKGIEEELTNLTLKKTLWQTDVNESCCKPDECWNGSACVSDSASVGAGDHFYYCSEGFWISGYTKSDWDNAWQGFCQEPSQCLVDPSFNMSITDPVAFWNDLPGERPMCINDGDSILDHFCNNGSWTSRTGLFADDMFSVANSSGSDFVLFCDSPSAVLLDVSEIDNDCEINGKHVPCFNNVCLVKAGDDMLVGSTLNIPVTDDKSFVSYFNADPDDFSGFTNKHDAYFKDSNSDVWYNDKLKAVVFSPTFSTINPGVRSSVFENKFQGIKSYVDDISGSAPTNYYFFKSPSFSRVFFVKKGIKEIFSFLETNKTVAGINYLGIDFKGVNLGVSPCDDFTDSFRGVNCGDQPVADHFYLAAFDITNSSRWFSVALPPLTDFWRGLTAKVRLR